ncbi:UvrD-helicase domain-containing protein [Rhizobium binxianense]
MAKYLALTQQTCSWMLAHPAVLSAFHSCLESGETDALRKGEFSAGQMRMAGTPDGNLIAAWNREYITGTGFETWAIIRLDGDFGLDVNPQIRQQVLEREIYVASQRLQSLIVDSEFIHRTWPNGSQTCLSGRGTEARQYSVCYFEAAPGYAGLSSKAIIIIGPGHDFDDLQQAIAAEMTRLAPLSKQADALVETKRRPLLDSPGFHALRQALVPAEQASFQFTSVNLQADYQPNNGVSAYETAHWNYEQWLANGTLNDAQRQVLESDVLNRHPVRVIGPAGSGKTLLMQLLALRHLRKAVDAREPIKMIYVVHNAPMAQALSDRFRVLGGEEYLTNPEYSLKITTLSELGRQIIGLADSMVIDKDAQETKMFQLSQVRQSLREALNDERDAVVKSPLMTQVKDDEELFNIFSPLVVTEISNVIKGRGLVDNEKGYVNSEAALSRLHGIMTPGERKVVFSCFRRYHAAIFEQYELLDSDDIALTLAGRLRTPLWRLKRKTEGFDFLFVDEAQLFNENERRIFSYLSSGKVSHVPIALALDEAQDLYAFSNAGLATLGISDVEDKNLPSNHRSTKEIVDLAFYIIQQTTDLFSNDFPDFQSIEKGMVSSTHALAVKPYIEACNEEQPKFGRFVTKHVQKLRASNIRQIAVVCHAETYWEELVEALSASGLPLHIFQQRGEKISPDQPLVILSRPAYVGGQEFDAVLSVGLEQGIVPPRIVDNIALASAVEQQVLREMYLVVSRARYRYGALLNRSALPNSILQGAINDGFISKNGT